MQDYIIGIDIGTGSTKAVAVNTRGDIIGTTQIHHSYIKTVDEHAEQDPALLLNAFYSCIKRIISDLGNLPSGISLSSGCHCRSRHTSHCPRASGCRTPSRPP